MKRECFRRTAAVIMLASTLVAPAADAKTRPRGAAPAAKSPCGESGADVANEVRGHAFVRSLYCTSGVELKQDAAIGTSRLPNGCFVDTYGVACADQRFQFDVEPGKPLPSVPPWLFSIDDAAAAKVRLADEKLESAPAEARAAMDDVLARVQQVPQLWRLRGLTEIMSGKLELALADLDRALALGPKQPLYRLEHAEVKSRLGDRRGALAELHALEKDVAPDWSRWRELLAVTASLLDEEKDPGAPAYRKRACAAGAKSFCAAAPPRVDGGAAER
jgi:hypothetical protein